MKLDHILFYCITLTITAFTSSPNTEKIVKAEEFIKFADTAGLKFEMPKGYKETYVKDNKDLWYCFAIKDKKADFEVRYTIWSLKPAVKEYENCKRDTNCHMTNPNSIYKARIQANVLNMTGGQSWNIGPFPPEAVRKEFNAESGGSSFFEFNCEYGKGYKYGQMVYLHKDNVADVIITYMSNDKATHPDLMMKSFHALTFK